MVQSHSSDRIIILKCGCRIRITKRPKLRDIRRFVFTCRKHAYDIEGRLR